MLKTSMIAVIALATVGTKAYPANSPLAGNHAAWSEVLKKFVHDGRVDYSGLHQENGQKAQRTYLEVLEGVKQAAYDAASNPEKLAFWINAYNAYTLAIVSKNMPVESIRKIGATPGAAWSERFIPIKVTGKTALSLNDIEHEIIRKQFTEPRVHAALVCAAKSCPKLLGEAYVALKLDAQLENQMTSFINDKTKNKIDAKTFAVSEIFKWFPEDFKKTNGDVRSYILRYHRGPKPNAGVVLTYLDYDWSLNGK